MDARLSKLIFSAVFFLLASVGSAQMFAGETDADKRNFQILTQGIGYLRSRPQPEQLKDPHTGGLPDSWKIYDTLIQKLYDRQYRIDSAGSFDKQFGSDDFQKLLLYNIDLALDVVPLDSIAVVMTGEEDTYPRGSAQSRWRMYSVCYIIDTFHLAIVSGVVFTSNNKILMIAPFIDFNKLNKGVDLEGFGKRHNFESIYKRRYEFKAN